MTTPLARLQTPACLALLIAGLLGASAQAAPATTPTTAPRATALAAPAADQGLSAAELQPLIDSLLARQVKADGPGAAVLVARGPTLLYRGARGLASLEHGVPLAPGQVFRIASVSKQFTTVALLKLAEEGRLSVDDPLSRHLPDFPGAAGITLAQLMDHTAGLANLTDQPGFMERDIRLDRSTAEMVQAVRDLPPDFPPGGDWRYSNTGYLLLGAVIEAVTGRPWHEAVTALTRPLGLVHTAWGDTRQVVPGMAEGYSTGADGRVQRADFISMTQPQAAGALVSTLDDLWRWQQALHGGRLLKPDSHRRLVTPQSPAARQAQYALGLLVQTLRGEPLWHHGGGIQGYLSSLMYLPQSELTVVVLRNSDGPGLDPTLLARQLAALALGKPYPDGPTVPQPLAERERLAGLWRLQGPAAAPTASTERVLRVAGDSLSSQRGGGPVLPLRHIGNGLWLFEGTLTRLEVQPDGRLHLFQNGEGPPEVWTRVGPAPPERAAIALVEAQRAALVGEYAAPALRMRIFIDEAGVLRTQVPGQPALALHAETPRRLYLREVDAQLHFVPDEGPVQAVTLLQGPVRLELRRQP